MKHALLSLLLVSMLGIAGAYAKPKAPNPMPTITADRCVDTASESAYLGISTSGPPLCFFIHHSDKSRLSVRTMRITKENFDVK